MNSKPVEGNNSPFTVSQLQELERQVMIFNYIIAGIPVPPELLLPVKRIFDPTAAARFFYPTMAWGSFDGKKWDPEPGRCRKTDGKKWRCSKKAHPDSNYCERHINRGRNHSVKPVETEAMSQSSPTVNSPNITGSSSDDSIQSLSLHSITAPEGHCPASNSSQLPTEPGS